MRPMVLWRQRSFGSDSNAGSRFAERLLTVVATCRQQGRPLVICLVTAGEGGGRRQDPVIAVPCPTGVGERSPFTYPV
jgi:transposase